MIKKISRIISVIFQPIFIPTIGISLLILSDPVFALLNTIQKVTIAFCIFLTTGIIPALIVVLGMATGNVSDGFISNRRERTWPYVISLLGYLGGCYWLHAISLPSFYIAPLIGSGISIIILTLINLKWKISAHGTAMGGLTGGIIAYSFLTGINPLLLICSSILISSLVCSSRMILKAHTFGQVTSGWILGFFAVSITWISYVFNTIL